MKRRTFLGLGGGAAGGVLLSGWSTAHAKAAAKVIKKSGWGVPGETWTPGLDDIDA